MIPLRLPFAGFARFVEVALAVSLALVLPRAAGAGDKKGAPVPAPVAVSVKSIDLPHYEPPASYSEDLVVETNGTTMVMKRAYDQGKMRMEINAEGKNMVMLELGDEQGTSHMLMPDEKRAFKQPRSGMTKQLEDAKKAGAKIPGAKGEAVETAPPADYTVEDLGEETLDGVVTRKMRVHAGGGEVLSWFDKSSGPPLCSRCPRTTTSRTWTR